MNNLKNMFTRLTNAGGAQQQERMIEDKRKTLQRAVKYSYQGAQVSLLTSTQEETVPALINPNRLQADYDEKIISVEFGHGFKTGEVFRWINPSRENGDTYWLIYLQDLTELAYFKANIRRCSYSIAWVDDNGEAQLAYAAIKGPGDKTISNISASAFNMDIPNYTISILMPKNKQTLEHFQRYTKFYLQGLMDGDTSYCWRVEAVDSISVPGVLEIFAKEYYGNDDQDDIATGVVNGLMQPIISNEQIMDENKGIVGDNFIKPNFTYRYEGIGDATWQFDSDLPLNVKIDANVLTLTWTASYSGQFTLAYGDKTKTIIVESLF